MQYDYDIDKLSGDPRYNYCVVEDESFQGGQRSHQLAWHSEGQRLVQGKRP